MNHRRPAPPRALAWRSQAPRLATLLVGVFLLQTLAWARMPPAAAISADAQALLWSLCTAHGLAQHEPRIGDTSPAVPTAMPHCDLCVFAQGLGTAPPVVLQDRAIRRLRRAAPPRHAHAATPLFHPHQPRAPPLA